MSASFSKGLILVALASASFVTRSHAEEEVTISAVRPLEEALTKLEQEFGVPITYEEAPYLFAEDLKAIDSQKPRTLRFSYLTIAMRVSEVRTNIQHVLDANNNGDHPPMIFALKEAGDRFHVCASRRRDEAGDYVPYDSPLDTIISMEPKERNEDEFLHELFAILLSRTNTYIGRDTIGLFGPPFGLPSGGRRIKIGAENKAARELLLQYFLGSEGEHSSFQHSWHLVCRGITASCGLTPYQVDVRLPEYVERRWTSWVAKHLSSAPYPLPPGGKTKPMSSGRPYPFPAGVRGLFGIPNSAKGARDAGE